MIFCFKELWNASDAALQNNLFKPALGNSPFAMVTGDFYKVSFNFSPMTGLRLFLTGMPMEIMNMMFSFPLCLFHILSFYTVILFSFVKDLFIYLIIFIFFNEGLSFKFLGSDPLVFLSS